MPPQHNRMLPSPSTWDIQPISYRSLNACLASPDVCRSLDLIAYGRAHDMMTVRIRLCRSKHGVTTHKYQKLRGAWKCFRAFLGDGGPGCINFLLGCRATKRRQAASHQCINSPVLESLYAFSGLLVACFRRAP